MIIASQPLRSTLCGHQRVHSREIFRDGRVWRQEAPLDQEQETSSKPPFQPPAGKRLSKRAAFVYSFAVQGIAAVALTHALLLPLLTGGWISALAYGLAALGLSSAALAVVGRRMARSVAGLRAALGRFGSSRDPATPFADTRSTGLDGLQHGLDKMYRRVARREKRLKAAYKAAELENVASRNLAKQLTRSQRIARIGSWEWERASNGIACSGEVFRILGVNPAQFSLRPTALRRLGADGKLKDCPDGDNNALGLWAVKEFAPLHSRQVRR